ncbi:MAG: hypothetical protein NZ610_07425 [Candidatus Bipolaricaulota bacterium]|nr:hypothetical protein [Candidatus Bipolaricaulota bacterium]MCS7275209.1 hypothetical protein [Candidatus Bipolaricaulota bacterium]MDW8111396.1 dockerin type I repeat-containing protein [Candidatus Bipolaricaulota bacterium]
MKQAMRERPEGRFERVGTYGVQRIRVVAVLLLSVFLGALAPMAWGQARGDDETDVFNSNLGNVNPIPNPGETFVVIQDVTVADPGARGDTTPDSFPTAIETVTIKKIGGTLEDHFVLALRLYMDDGDGEFNLPNDRLLGSVNAPRLTQGVVFGQANQLLVLVPNNGLVQFYVVADFANDAPDGATLRTSFDLTVGDGLLGGPPVSSRIDPATALPILNADAGLPPELGCALTCFIRITATSGRQQTDVIDETPARTAHPGDTVVLQEFAVSDPGASSDAIPDEFPTLIRTVTVRKVGGTIPSERILRLRLYRESPRTPPGWQPEDELLATVHSPNLEQGVVFGDGGRRLARVNDGSEEHFYIVADLAPVGLADGDTLRTSVELVVRDDLTDPGEGSSAIETPMPVVAQNQLVVKVPPPLLMIGSASIVGKTKIPVSVRFVPAPGLGEVQIGPDAAIVFDPEIIQILSIKGVGPYTVNSVNIDSLAGRAQFTVTLKPGRTALNEGVIAEIEIDKAPDAPVGVSVDLLIESEDGIEIVDVFRDKDGRDLIPDVMPGRVTIKLLKGDVDKDNVVTMSDARLVARFVLGLETLAPEQEEAADVAPPIGVIDATDVRWIAQAAAGLRKLNNSLYSVVTLSDREKLSADRVRASAQMRSGRLEFRVAEARAAETIVRIFSLSGAPVLTASAAGATVHLSEAELAQLPNGVYLYTVTALGPDGRWHQSQLEKLIVLR